MAKKIFNGLFGRIKQMTIDACSSLGEKSRFIIILVMFLALGVGSLIVTIRSAYNIGNKNVDKEFIQIDHIKSLDLQNDSINLNYHQYGRE